MTNGRFGNQSIQMGLNGRIMHHLYLAVVQYVNYWALAVALSHQRAGGQTDAHKTILRLCLSTCGTQPKSQKLSSFQPGQGHICVLRSFPLPSDINCSLQSSNTHSQTEIMLSSISDKTKFRISAPWDHPLRNSSKTGIWELQFQR